ncbi:MAG: DUF4837 family protein [Bacteroidales bacterium]|nr:DUF4837 family protein [Bacteroidales bacterium]
MKSIVKPLTILLMAIAVSACSDKPATGKKDRSAGGTSEILVVTQNKEQWDGMIGDSIRHYFLDYQYGLPQPEAQNDLAHITLKGFSDMFKKHKCILEVEINPHFEFAKAETAENLWAAPQRYVKITAPNATSWVELFESQKEVYKLWFDKVERERILSVFRPSVDNNIVNAIKEKMGFTLTVPQGFYIAKNEPNFMWLRKELERSSSCLLIYQTPYHDTAQFSVNSLVAMRNMMLKQYIPGPLEGSYMATETEFVPPLVNYVPDFPAGYAVEMRGMWKVENDFMGGPFVSYTFADQRTGNLVTVEGYYYEPNQKKRNSLLQLEAILYSLKLVE